MQVPAHALYGASTQRAVLNFPVSGRPVPFGIIAAYAYLSGVKALGVSPWEGHCYPQVFQDLVAQYRTTCLKGSQR